MTTEAKVGAFTLVGIAILTAVLLQLQGFSFSTSRNYTIYVGFTQVVGLAPEADVRYAYSERCTNLSRGEQRPRRQVRPHLAGWIEEYGLLEGRRLRHRRGRDERRFRT